MTQPSNAASSQEASIKLFGLIRDRNGRPVIDDGNDLPPEIFSQLTLTEQEELTNDNFAYSRRT